MMKTGCRHPYYGNLKLAVYQNKLMNYTDIVHADINSGKLKVDLNLTFLITKRKFANHREPIIE